MMDTGSSTGEILGHSKVCLSSNLDYQDFSVKTTPAYRLSMQFRLDTRGRLGQLLLVMMV
jgi:hypothetical protein